MTRIVDRNIYRTPAFFCLQKQSIVILGDLSMDPLIPDRGEGKMLRDLEQVYDLTCLITEPTRVTMHSRTLLDVLLINTPELFTRSGVYDPEISDQYLIYGQIKFVSTSPRP